MAEQEGNCNSHEELVRVIINFLKSKKLKLPSWRNRSGTDEGVWQRPHENPQLSHHSVHHRQNVHVSFQRAS